MTKRAAWTASIPVFALLASPAGGAEDERFWPQWRGPLQTGAAPKGDPPSEWGEGKNVKWKVEVPGKGWATPVVWEDKIFLLTAIPSEKKAPAPAAPASGAAPQGRLRSVPADAAQQFAVLALDRKDGKRLWQRVVREELPHEGTHPTASFASNSAVTDGERVYAFFGSRGIYALDLK